MKRTSDLTSQRTVRRFLRWVTQGGLTPKVFIAPALLVVIGIILFGLLTWRNSFANIKARQTDRIRLLAKHWAGRLDGDELLTVIKAPQEKDIIRHWSDASECVNRLHRILVDEVQTDGLAAPVYALCLRRDYVNRVRANPDRIHIGAMYSRLTSDSEPHWDQSHDYRPAMAAALFQGKVSTEDVHPDGHGECISAYAPVEDRKGKTVAVLEVDIPLSDLLATLNRELATHVGTMIACFALPGFLVFLLAARLRNAAARTQAIVETAVNGIFTIDERGIITSVNPAAERIFQYGRVELIGRNINALMPSPHHEAHDGYLAHYLRTGEKKIIGTGKEVIARRKDDTTFPAELAVSEMRVGRKRAFAGIVCDITERKHAEDALARAGNAAQDANRAKSEFLANMSHELRTPLTAILGFAELLGQRLVKEDDQKDIGTIERNGQHLLAVINDLLDLSKIEAGEMTVEHIATAPCEVVAQVISMLGVRCRSGSVSLDLEYDGRIPKTIQSDPTALRQILTNLVGNAIKFTQTGSVRLVVRLVDGEEPRLQFDVVDTGIGMTGEQVGRLFRPYAQGDPSMSRRFGGTGLGLTISRKLARLLGGDVVVADSEPSVGTHFRATISTGPLNGVEMLDNPGSATILSDSAYTKEPGSAGSTVPKNEKVSLANRRVLLAEDSPDNQRLIAHIVRKAGAEVTIVDNGKLAVDAALDAIQQVQPFDVILMDIQMPIMDGYEATRQLRRKGYARPIIALTAHATTGNREECLAVGCDDYATKPINRTKLIEVITRYAGKSSAPEYGTIEAGRPPAHNSKQEGAVSATT